MSNQANYLKFTEGNYGLIQTSEQFSEITLHGSWI